MFIFPLGEAVRNVHWTVSLPFRESGEESLPVFLEGERSLCVGTHPLSISRPSLSLYCQGVTKCCGWRQLLCLKTDSWSNCRTISLNNTRSIFLGKVWEAKVKISIQYSHCDFLAHTCSCYLGSAKCRVDEVGSIQRRRILLFGAAGEAVLSLHYSFRTVAWDLVLLYKPLVTGQGLDVKSI